VSVDYASTAAVGTHPLSLQVRPAKAMHMLIEVHHLVMSVGWQCILKDHLQAHLKTIELIRHILNPLLLVQLLDLDALRIPSDILIRRSVLLAICTVHCHFVDRKLSPMFCMTSCPSILFSTLEQ
jgi:hypothetical protein